jgi:hypothetical protein
MEMNYPGNGSAGNESGSAEETLRLIAKLPAPEGLEERVIAGVRARRLAAPRGARVLEFPGAPRLGGGRLGGSWMRSAAAAAIVCVVVGGGWGVYSRVQQPQAAKVIVIPARGAGQGGFSNAGAMRTPTTLNGPVVANPVVAQPMVVQPVTPKPAQARVSAPEAKNLNPKGTAGVASKTTAQPTAR